MLFFRSRQLLRQGRKRPLPRAFGDRFRREPAALKPLQGGQPMFQQLMLEKANKQAELELRGESDSAFPTVLNSSGHDEFSSQSQQGRLGLYDFITNRQDNVTQVTPHDEWTTKRGFNSLEWAESISPASETGDLPGFPSQSGEGSPMVENQVQTTYPPRITDERVFREKYGFSLLQQRSEQSAFPREAIAYNELDMWGEMPRYTPDMYFLYVITRRRNTYAVMYTCSGVCVHRVMTAGNLKLKEGDRGWRAEGSSEFGHIVVSKYLDAAYPKALTLEANAGRLVSTGSKPKINLVVRVMGFYNGRQGAMKAILDRRDQYTVRILEDVTPVPQNGPKMPKLRM